MNDERPAISLSVNSSRVLGALLEKELTVPASYPLTMNALLTACNQTSGRDPVMNLTEAEVDTALAALRAFGLSRVVHASHGARSTKYRQVADEVLRWDGAERAVMTVLLLRGAQTVGELRSRSERLHAFASTDQVDAVLRNLASRDTPHVELLDRQPGQKEARWRHTLMPAAAYAATVPPSTVLPGAVPPSGEGSPTGPSAPGVGPASAPNLSGTWVDGAESLVLTLDGDALVVDTLIDGELFERRRWIRAESTPDGR